MKKDYLMTPGPTPVPPEVLLSMAKPIIHHRTPQFQAIIKECVEGLKYVFQTQNDVFIFTSSGTGAMEASVCSVLSPGDKAITVQGGKFGERWTELCKSFGVAPVVIDVKWGQKVNPVDIENILRKDKSIRAVYTTLCETSTGVTADIKTIGEIVKKFDAVLVVDAISGLGAVEFKTDEWSVDLAVAGSQKGLMIPPGLAFITVSPKAWKLIETCKSPRYYFDLRLAKKAMQDTDTPFTPAITLFIGLAEALKMIKTEGLDTILARHKRMSEAVRNAVQALGLKLYAPTAYSDAVTSVYVPEGVDGNKLVKIMRDKYGVGIAGGQSELKGKIFRVATMGYMTEFDCVVAISALETVLKESGYKFNVGSGLKAAQEVLLKS